MLNIAENDGSISRWGRTGCFSWRIIGQCDFMVSPKWIKGIYNSSWQGFWCSVIVVGNKEGRLPLKTLWLGSIFNSFLRVRWNHYWPGRIQRFLRSSTKQVVARFMYSRTHVLSPQQKADG